MFKQILLPLFSGLFFISAAQAGVKQQSVKKRPVVKTDTSIKKDFPFVTIPDPKLGFKDLFISSSKYNNGSTGEQLNPLAISFVQDYIDRFGKSMEDMKGWGKPYFDMMDAILIQHGLPKELKYLAVIESNLKPNVRSWAGAVGPWQFMPGTARNLGLQVNKYYDERTDYFKSTHAASRYLTNLFSIYGDWLLVIAAYNGGPGNVNAAIRKSGSKDFWVLQNYLPVESKNHVKKFIATHYIMEGQGGITTATKDEVKNSLLNNTGSLYSLSKEDLANTTAQLISGRYNASVIIKHISIDLSAFNKLNPDFDKQIALNGVYELRLPNDKLDIFTTKKNDILTESMQLLLGQPADTISAPRKKAF